MQTLDQQIQPLIPDWAKLLLTLKQQITDDMRATDDPDDETPGMQVTIGFTPAGPGRWDEASWSY